MIFITGTFNIFNFHQSDDRLNKPATRRHPHPGEVRLGPLSARPRLGMRRALLASRGDLAELHTVI